MKKTLIACAAASLLLAGCATNPADNALYQQDLAGCQAGNRDACTALNYQGQKVAAEQAQDAQTANTAVAVGGAALLGALVGLSAAHPYYPHPVFVHPFFAR